MSPCYQFWFLKKKRIGGLLYAGERGGVKGKVVPGPLFSHFYFCILPLSSLKRFLLKKCIEEKEFPDLDKVNMDNDPNMRFVKDMCDDLLNQGYKSLPTEVCGIFHDLSIQSSTINLFQVMGEDIMNDLAINLSSNTQLLKDTESLQLKLNCTSLLNLINVFHHSLYSQL